jgi:hypothetical protein
MADTKISNLTVLTSPLSSDVFPIVNNNVTKQVSLYNAFNTAAIPIASSNFIYVTTGSSASANGINLLNSYTRATTLTPNTSALSSTNRTTLVLFPGNYNLGLSSLRLNTQYVDVVGLTRDASHATITSSNSTATISQTANDVRCIGFTINNTVSAPGWLPSSNLSQTYWENVMFNSISANNLSGYFKDCKSTNKVSSLGGFVGASGTTSGTFISCTGANSGGSAGGGFVGQSGTASGTFIDCTGINSVYGGGGFVGYGGTVSGTFTNCTGVSNGAGDSGGFVGYGGTVSGTFTNCTGTSNDTSGGGFTGYQGIASGTFTNCTGINNGVFGGGFAGQRGTASGIFTDCNGRNTGNNGAGGFVGAVGIASGTFINCIGANSGVNSGGLVGLNATTNGRFINCISNDITLPTLTTSGLSAKPACYVNCLDGSGRLVNGSA